MTVTCPIVVNLLSATAGAGGTFLIYKGSFAFEHMGGYMNQQLINEMGERNNGRARLQKAGLVLLFASFLLQALAQFVS